MAGAGRTTRSKTTSTRFPIVKRPSNANPRYSYAFGNLASSYLALKDYSKALAALDKAIELKTNFLWSRLTGRRSWNLLVTTQTALKDYEYALVIDPSNQTANDGVIRLMIAYNATASSSGCVRLLVAQQKYRNRSSACRLTIKC